MTSLSGVVDWIRGHGCERLVRYTANEIEISGLSLGAGTFKADVGKFSNKIKELERANELAKALDDCQYLLCTTLDRTEMSDSLRDQVNSCRIMTIMSITQLRTLLAALDQQDEVDLKRELREWIRYTNALFRQATEALGPRQVYRVYYGGAMVRKTRSVPKRRAKPRAKAKAKPKMLKAVAKPIHIGEIMRYQGINESELKTAVAFLR